MQLYIDPGTGSMLFTVLVGVLGAAIYGLRNLIVKMQFVLSGGKQEKRSDNTIPFVIYSDDKRYWSTFRPICQEFERRKVPVTFMTASPDDPALKEKFDYVTCQFIGEGNKGFAKLNMLRADVLLATTPGLDVYQWKRSKDVKYYVHVLHAPTDATTYRLYGLDYYDAVLLSGEYHIPQLRELEQLRNLPPKELEIVGVPYMDELYKRLQNTPNSDSDHPTTVLLAPTWGATGTLSRYGKRILQALLDTGYHIIVRPHPQSFKSEKELMESLMKEFPESDQMEWSREGDNFDVLNRADIMISDFSGVIFDYSLVFGKPVLYADIGYIKDPYDCYWLKDEIWMLRVLPEIGSPFKEEDLPHLKEVIDQKLQSAALREGIDRARKESWANIGHSAERTVDYLIRKHDEILEVTEK